MMMSMSQQEDRPTVSEDDEVHHHLPILPPSPEGSLNGSNSLIHRLVMSLLLPLTIPFMLYKFYRLLQWRRKKQKELHGKVVLITGASSGLGEALAHCFYKAGCRLILAARRKEELERVKKELLLLQINDPTRPPAILPLDLENLNQLPALAKEAVDIYGCVDILVNNGGISYRGEVLNTSIDVDIKVMVVNYFGQVALTKEILPSMVKRKQGHIVAISSVQGKMAIPCRSAYAASKHALQAFCDTLRSEVDCHNIKVTVVNPGYIQTNLSVNAITGSGQKYGVTDSTTASGYSPAAVAEAVLKGVVLQDAEVTPSSLGPRAMIIIRYLFPTLYFWFMRLRYNKFLVKAEKDK